MKPLFGDTSTIKIQRRSFTTLGGNVVTRRAISFKDSTDTLKITREETYDSLGGNLVTRRVAALLEGLE
jgi:hypothetical protein